MSATVTPANQILDILARSNGCLLEDILRDCPALTWNQVFLELDQLSRTGEVRLSLKGAGQYFVMLKDEVVGTA